MSRQVRELCGIAEYQDPYVLSTVCAEDKHTDCRREFVQDKIISILCDCPCHILAPLLADNASLQEQVLDRIMAGELPFFPRLTQ